MLNFVCKGKSVYDGSLVYGYYVQAPWAGRIAHLIISLDAEYQGSGKFDWRGVYRVDPDTVCYVDNTELME